MDFEDDKLDRMSHHIETMAKELYVVRKAVINKEKEKEKIAKKEKKPRESLKKAQKKFKNISTNFNIEDFQKIEKRLKELGISKSNYIQKLVLLDLKEKLLKKEYN